MSSQTFFWPEIEVRPDHIRGVTGGPVRNQDHIPCVIEVGLDPEEHMSLKDQLQVLLGPILSPIGKYTGSIFVP